MVDSIPSSDHGSFDLGAVQHWMPGFLLQTLAYGINLTLFLMCTYVLIIHIFKATRDHRFHKRHLMQNYALLVYITVMFAFATLVMAHQGRVAVDSWDALLNDTTKGNKNDVIQHLFGGQFPLQRACSASVFLINNGTIAFLLWRCLVYWKVNSIFPGEILALPFLTFLACFATGLIQLIKDWTPSSLSGTAETVNWLLIYWGLTTGLYYFLSILIVTRVCWHRRIIHTQTGKHVNRFTNVLTIVCESILILPAFATAHLVILAKFPELALLFPALLAQIQVMIPLVIVQRLAAGKAWTGKILDCVLNSHPESGHPTKVEEVTTMAFNANTETSSTQNDELSEVEEGNKELNELRRAVERGRL